MTECKVPGCTREARTQVFMLNQFVGSVCEPCYEAIDRMIPSGGPVRGPGAPLQLHITVTPPKDEP